MDKLQTQDLVKKYFEVKFDLKSQGRSSHQTTGILTQVFYISGPNLVILAWAVDELLHRQQQFLKAKSSSLWLKKCSEINSYGLYKIVDNMARPICKVHLYRIENSGIQICDMRFKAARPTHAFW